jgi:hypothetical protein
MLMWWLHLIACILCVWQHTAEEQQERLTELYQQLIGVTTAYQRQETQLGHQADQLARLESTTHTQEVQLAQHVKSAEHAQQQYELGLNFINVSWRSYRICMRIIMLHSRWYGLCGSLESFPWRLRRLAATTAALEAARRELQDAHSERQRQRDLLAQYEGVMATQARSLQVRQVSADGVERVCVFCVWWFVDVVLLSYVSGLSWTFRRRMSYCKSMPRWRRWYIIWAAVLCRDSPVSPGKKEATMRSYKFCSGRYAPMIQVWTAWPECMANNGEQQDIEISIGVKR